MKKAPIYMKSWLDANKRERTEASDTWYLEFAIQVLPVIEASPLFARSERDVQVKAALAASLYLQNIIAQEGNWKCFTEKYQTLYHRHLPFYDTQTDEYISDEINSEDLALVYWSFLSGPRHSPKHSTILQSAFCKESSFLNPFDEELLNLSNKLYDRMDAVFENAPISDHPSPHWFMNDVWLDISSQPIPKITADTHLKKDVERCLAYSKGHPLLYFADYKALHTFFMEVLKWDEEDWFSDLGNRKEFVIYANARGMLLALDVAAYFCDERNPLYDSHRASSEGYRMFTDSEVCPFDLLKYGMAHGLLPDVQLPFSKGKEVLQQNWDFIARYYLHGYYEGR